jgi:hypothetical protein
LNVSLRVTAPADEQIIESRLQAEVGVGIAPLAKSLSHLSCQSEHFGSMRLSQRPCSTPAHSTPARSTPAPWSRYSVLAAPA